MSSLCDVKCFVHAFFFWTIIVSYYSIALCFCHYPSWSKLGVMFSACIQWTAVKEELMQHLQLRQGRRAVWLFLCSWLYYWLTLRWLISCHLVTIKANILSLFVFFIFFCEATKSRRYRIRHVRDLKICGMKSVHMVHMALFLYELIETFMCNSS